MDEEQIAYHRARAARELNLGLACDCLAAARSHLKLSSLHFERAKRLNEGQAEARPPFIMA